MKEPVGFPQSDGYPTTQWTQVFDALQKGNVEQAWPALETFCHDYRPAIHRFFARHSISPEQAADYTQRFFEKKIMEKWAAGDSFLQKVKRKEGYRFRSFLCAVLWRFLQDEWTSENSQKAGGMVPHSSLQELLMHSDLRDEKASNGFGHEFDREFAFEILRRTANRSEHSSALLDHFQGHLSQKEAAAEMGITENAFKAAYSRFRGGFARDLREEVRKLAGPDEAEVEAELRYLISLFPDRPRNLPPGKSE